MGGNVQQAFIHHAGRRTMDKRYTVMPTEHVKINFYKVPL
jgi:hypothetical protein